ncbi:VPS10 domain-containing protein [Catalinimonas alkaloidigena]|uniref:VPS10 domain-containing protein n=1 Tax=Catalinimonas alkaloidigena TaxID=1075417 RepID=UPI002406497F|nr:glycosyl hydrolase [Catalinimonas alkaloidigena]
MPFRCIAQQKQQQDKSNKNPDSALFEGLKFRNIGPFRGGRSVAVSGVIQQPLVYYMGSTGGGIWKTEDAGLSWKNISDGQLKTGSVGDISVAESDPNVIYVGMGEHAIRGVMTTHGDGVYKSTDAGNTWAHIGLDKTRHISDIIIHPENPDIVYVAAQGAAHGPTEDRGIYKTTNGGESWEKVLYVDEKSGASGLTMDMTNPRILYAAFWEHQRYPWKVKSGGEGSGIYKSTDAGESWEELTEGLPELMGKIGISVSRANPDRIWANIEAEEGGVYRSDDGGQKWTLVCDDRVTQARSWYYMEVFADPQDEETVYVLNAPMLKSIDGGNTFKPVSTPHGDNHDLWIHPENNQQMINANDGGANISFNGGKSWSTQENQPTVQFYRVITDNRFPYYVYGGQQDNSTVAIASRNAEAGIGWKDWYAVSGGESAFLAFNEDDPQLVYGGSYQGNISVYDHTTGMTKDLMAYPVVGLGSVPREMKYRFNWNAPIIMSQHDKKTIYHGANIVLKSTDGGLNWEETSPDLTRNDTSKQGLGGEPFTNEGAGGENYNTLAYLLESPHQQGVLWAGSDCGLVHITRDGGQNWHNVTPKDAKEGIINAIEVSAHDPSTVYVTLLRYKMNDFTPYVYKTTDNGQSWTEINQGFEEEDFVRVVREDPKKKDLLYAGTEGGMYISYNGGENWYPFQLNLPVCPINDMTFRDNDLVVATSGRGFWILDDLGALQQSDGVLSDLKMQLFEPKPTIKLNASVPDEAAPGLGENPMNGVIVDYYLQEEVADSVMLTLEVLDKSGEVIRTMDNQKQEDFQPYPGGPGPKQPIPAKAGVNRFAWDFRKDDIPNVPKVFVMGDYRGHLVAPGAYQIRLTLGEESQIVSCTILPDPRLNVTAADFASQQQMLNAIEENVISIHESVNAMRKVKEQVKSLTVLLKAYEGTAALLDSGKSLITNIEAWEENLIQPRQKTFQDVINFPNQLNAELLNLRSRIDEHDPRVTEGAHQRLNDLIAEWNEHQQALRKIIDVELATFNEMYKQQNIPAIILEMPEEKPIRGN